MESVSARAWTSSHSVHSRIPFYYSIHRHQSGKVDHADAPRWWVGLVVLVVSGAHLARQRLELLSDSSEDLGRVLCASPLSFLPIPVTYCKTSDTVGLSDWTSHLSYFIPVTSQTFSLVDHLSELLELKATFPL